MMKIIDWKYVRGASFSSGAMLVGRVLGFAFTLIVANIFDVTAYGSILYVIAISELISLLIKPFFQHVIAYYLARSNAGSMPDGITLKAVWTVGAIIIAATFLVGPALTSAFGTFAWSSLAVVAGSTVYYGYYGIVSGHLAPGRFVGAYLGSNALQAVLVLLVAYLPSLQREWLVVSIYGLSYIPPVLLLSRLVPIQTGIALQRVTRGIRQVFRFSFPILITHALYTAYVTVDVLLLEMYGSVASVGIYGLTRTLTSVFWLVPNGVNVLLVPKLAGMESSRRPIIILSLGIAGLVSIVALVPFILLYKPVIESFFGPDFYIGLNFGVTAAVASILFGMHGIVGHAAIGVNRASWGTFSRAAMLISAIALGLVLVPRMGPLGAAINQGVSTLTGLAVYAIAYWLHRFRKRPTRFRHAAGEATDGARASDI